MFRDGGLKRNLAIRGSHCDAKRNRARNVREDEYDGWRSIECCRRRGRSSLPLAAALSRENTGKHKAINPLLTEIGSVIPFTYPGCLEMCAGSLHKPNYDRKHPQSILTKKYRNEMKNKTNKKSSQLNEPQNKLSTQTRTPSSPKRLRNSRLGFLID